MDLARPEIPERLPGEPTRAYRTFTVHCAGGSQRTRAKTAEEANCSERSIKRWEKAYDWKNRIAEYDRQTATVAAESTAKTREVVRDKIVSVLPTLLDAMIEVLVDRDQRASTRVPAILRLLELGGITPPRRMELTIQDPRAQELDQARAEYSALAPEAKLQLARLLGVAPMAPEAQEPEAQDSPAPEVPQDDGWDSAGPAE